MLFPMQPKDTVVWSTY